MLVATFEEAQPVYQKIQYYESLIALLETEGVTLQQALTRVSQRSSFGVDGTDDDDFIAALLGVAETKLTALETELAAIQDPEV